MNMSFETYQLMVNEDHTSGCRRTASRNRARAVACRRQQLLAGSVRQLRQTRLKRFDTTHSLLKLQRPLRLATQLLPAGPLIHMCYICITETQK